MEVDILISTLAPTLNYKAEYDILSMPNKQSRYIMPWVDTIGQVDGRYYWHKVGSKGPKKVGNNLLYSYTFAWSSRKSMEVSKVKGTQHKFQLPTLTHIIKLSLDVGLLTIFENLKPRWLLKWLLFRTSPILRAYITYETHDHHYKKVRTSKSRP